MEKQYKVYWIKRSEHTNVATQGYVGITCDFENRMRSHKRLLTNPHFTNAIVKYGWENLEQIVIAEGLTEFEAKATEVILRPIANVGWNVAAGGEGGNTGFRLVNIYDKHGRLANNKLQGISEFCRAKGLTKTNLFATAHGYKWDSKRSGKSSSGVWSGCYLRNYTQHKGYYARFVDENGDEIKPTHKVVKGKLVEVK